MYLNRYYLKNEGTCIKNEGVKIFKRIITQKYQFLFPNEMGSLEKLFAKVISYISLVFTY